MLFDTNVLIWALKGDTNAQRKIDGDGNRFVSAVSYMELIQGTRDKREQRLIKQFLSALDFEVLPITEAVSHLAIIFVEKCALKSGIRLTDALVFSAACEYSIRLCSANQKNFWGIASLDAKVFKLAAG